MQIIFFVAVSMFPEELLAYQVSMVRTTNLPILSWVYDAIRTLTSLQHFSIYPLN